MSTSTTTPRRSRRVLVPLATLVAATGIAVASGATFNTSSASSALAASGTLRQINSNSVAFSKDNLKPGDTVTGSVSITNSGSLPAQFTLTEATVSNTFSPAADVTVAITDETGAAVAGGTLGNTGATSLGVFTPGQKHTYTFKVTFAATATNAQQGKKAETTYTFSSVQTAATDYTGTQGGTSVDVP